MAPSISDYRPTLNEQYKKLENPIAPPSGQAEIDWVPSFEKYQARARRSLKDGPANATLPVGFPQMVEYPMAWKGDEVASSEYLQHLSTHDIEEIEQALSSFKALQLPNDFISKSNFPLPNLGPRLRQMAHNVHDGRGLAILRGLDPTKYSLADNVIIYAGVSSYIGGKRGVQDPSGNVLVHIKDVGAGVAPDDKRQSPYANNAQPFHNDLGNIIAMYVMDRAESGGCSKLASTANVYNEIAASRPDLIRVLQEDNWVFDKHRDDRSSWQRPVLFHDSESNKVFFCFSRRQLTGSTVSPRPAWLPRLTENQAEALDAVHFAAEKDALTIRLERGDIQFVNNLGVFHSREAFTDAPDNHRRHLIRMWLRNEDLSWPTPDGLRGPWKEIYSSGLKRVWYMNADHEMAHVINKRTSCHG